MSDILKPSDRNSRKDRIYNALAVIMTAVIPLSLTHVLWERERDRAQQNGRAEFEFRVRETNEAIRARMLGYEQALRAASAMLATNGTATRRDWHEYVQLLNISKNYPGMESITYAPVIPAERRGEFVASVRRSGMTNYQIWPRSNRPSSAPTLYIEPYTDTDLRDFGFDLYSNPIHLAALENAADSGIAALTADIELGQNTSQASRTTLAMYVPVYGRETERGTVPEHRAALAGFIGGRLRVNDVLEDLIGDRYNLDLSVSDASGGAAVTPLAEKRANIYSPVAKPKFSAQTRLDLNNRIWTLSYSSTPAFERSVTNDKSRLILFGGLLFSSVLMALIWSLASTRNRALKLAHEMTTELRVKQDALTISEERLHLAMEGSDLTLFDWNVATGSVELSTQWASMLGQPPHPTVIAIQNLSRLVHPEDMPRIKSELRAVLNGAQSSYSVEHRVKTTSGEWLWILSRAKVVKRNAAARALRVTGTIADITERKRVDQMKNEFVGNVSHELRTPLTVIVGSLAMLRADLTNPTADQNMLLAMASENSTRLQALVNDILDFEKIASGAMPLDMQRVDIGPFLNRAIELNHVYAERFNVRYELGAPLPEIAVHADPERLMQVVTNLLSNAAKFSPAGATVTVTVTANKDGDRDWVRISVTDCGPGIALEFRNRIFQKFAQADSSDTRQKGGTGLGLSICKAIIEKLGGRIGYESEPGKGATFYVDLPRETDRA